MKSLEDRIGIYLKEKEVIYAKYKALEKPPKDFKNPLYTGGIGSFYLRNATTEGCRDRLQSALDSDPEFGFYTTESIETYFFMRLVEKLALVKKEDLVKYCNTGAKDRLHIKLSPWWNYRVRRSLYTALLRSSTQFSPKHHTVEGFKKVLLSGSYVEKTKDAVFDFLSGKTAFKVKKNAAFNGWYQMFGNNSNRTLLTRNIEKPPVLDFQI